MQATQLTERVVKAEHQVEDEKLYKQRAVKQKDKVSRELEKTKQALVKVRVRSEEYRRMTKQYAKFEKVAKELDEAKQLVSLFHLPTHVILSHRIINTYIHSCRRHSSLSA